jgi:hypothetical protein
VLNPDLATVNSEHMVFGAQPGLVRVNENQVRVEHMDFGAQPGLDGVKSGLSICFFEAQPGLRICESHPKRISFAQPGLSKSGLS